MTPPIRSIPVSALESELNVSPTGKPRRPPIALSECALKELVQFKCNIHAPERQGLPPTVLCQPIVRLFRL